MGSPPRITMGYAFSALIIHHSQGLSSFLVQLPPPISTEGGTTFFAPTIREQAQGAPNEETDSSRLGTTALEQTFNPDLMLLQDLKTKFDEQCVTNNNNS
jgi:hypothetical protein